MKYTPRQYQIEGAQFLREKQYAMLGDAPGVGKTGQALMAMNPSWKVLIVCPASVKIQWQQAVLDWINRPSSVINSSKDPFFSKMRGITIINYDLLIRENILNGLLCQSWDLIIYDEAHKLKSLSAKRTKVALGQKF